MRPKIYGVHRDLCPDTKNLLRSSEQALGAILTIFDSMD